MNPKTKNVLRALFLFALWVASGIWANLHWHFKENTRLQGHDLPYIVNAGTIMGPFNWPYGYITSYEFRHKTLIEKPHPPTAGYYDQDRLFPFAAGSSLSAPTSSWMTTAWIPNVNPYAVPQWGEELLFYSTSAIPGSTLMVTNNTGIKIYGMTYSNYSRYRATQTITPFSYGSSLASPSTNPPVYYWTGTNAGFHFITIPAEYEPYTRPYPWEKDLTTNRSQAVGSPIGTNRYGIPWFKRGTNAFGRTNEFGLIGPTNLAPSNVITRDNTVPHRIGYTYDGNIVLALSNRLHVHWDYPGFQFFLVPATEQEIASLTNLFRTNLNRRTLLFTD